MQQLNEQLANAVKERNLERVKELIGDGAEVKVVYRHGFTPLHLAINSGCKEIVGFLLNKGAYTKIGPSICQAVS
ncbi:ankyrin repeat domain-containing protein [Wolbachia pipientis]|uniref:ankyrin repeat domain-containing protein n=1 Tax=Wolbachia pipientis TaxID=955 RepID=UPI0025A39424|nr:ankyrin repeat domain-containing protein [Wolbachia pipientis]MDM8335704.1 ankyrin repeat domain-containing protein [Wolbachia pipientis]